MSDLHIITVPKWGLSMEEGQVVAWHKAVGDAVAAGDDLVDIETSKITNVVEAKSGGILRRIVATPGTTLPCGAALGVIGSGADSDADIDRLIAEQEHRAVQVEASLSGPVPVMAETVLADERHRIRYLELGTGDSSVVLIHGFGGDLENWMFNQPGLAADRRVFAVDLPGHGGSDKRVASGSARDLAEALYALLETIAPGPVHLVGHSFGAVVARELRGLRPDRVLTVTAIAPADLGTVNPAYVDDFIAARRRSEMAAAASWLFHKPELVSRDMVEDLLRYKRLDGVEAALRSIAACNFADPSARPAALSMWQELRGRGMIIWGSNDAILTGFSVDQIDSRVRTLEIAEAGHMPHVEKADQVTAAIAAHLNGHAQP